LLGLLNFYFGEKFNFITLPSNQHTFIMSKKKKFSPKKAKSKAIPNKNKVKPFLLIIKFSPIKKLLKKVTKNLPPKALALKSRKLFHHPKKI
jgi:hypothetical protein